MSVRAYKVTEIKRNKSDSFSFGNDCDLVTALDLHYQLNEDSCGLAEVSVRQIKDAIESCELDENTLKQLKEDIFGLDDDDYIKYYCY